MYDPFKLLSPIRPVPLRGALHPRRNFQIFLEYFIMEVVKGFIYTRDGVHLQPVILEGVEDWV